MSVNKHLNEWEQALWVLSVDLEVIAQAVDSGQFDAAAAMLQQSIQFTEKTRQQMIDCGAVDSAAKLAEGVRDLKL